MPVHRERAAVRPGLVRSPQSRGLAQGADTSSIDNVIASGYAQAAQLGNAVGRMMGEDAQMEAQGLASAIQISRDSDGVPLRPETEYDLGVIGRRAYDNQIEQRMGYLMQDAVETQVRNAYLENPYDPIAFQSAAEKSLQRMQGNVESGMLATFEELGVNAMRNYGARIGATNAQQVRQQTSFDHEQSYRRLAGQAVTQFSLGNYEAGLGIMGQIGQGLDELNTYYMNDEAKSRLREEFWQESIGGYFRHKMNLIEPNDTNIKLAGNMLRQLENQEFNDQAGVMEIFRNPDTGQIDARAVNAAKAYLRGFIQSASDGYRRAADEQEQANLFQRMVRGDFFDKKSPNNDMEAAFTQFATQKLDPLLSNGSATDARFWTNWSEMGPEAARARNNYVTAVKNSGLVPDSLRSAFAQLSAGLLDNEQIDSLYHVWNNLRGGQNTDGSVIDVATKLTDDVNGKMSIYHAMQNGQFTRLDKSQLVRLMKVQPFEHWEDYARMAEDFGDVGSKPKLKQTLDQAAFDQLSQDFPASQREVNQAVGVWKLLAASGVAQDPSTAMEAAANIVGAGLSTDPQNRMVDPRPTPFSPTAAYPRVQDMSIIEGLNAWSSTSVGRAFDRWKGETFGTTEFTDVTANWAEIDYHIDGKIRGHVKELLAGDDLNPEQRDYFETMLKGPIEGDIDYKLEAVGQDPSTVRYKVYIRGANGLTLNDFGEGLIIDYAGTYQRLKQSKQAIGEAKNSLRVTQMEFDNEYGINLPDGIGVSALPIEVLEDLLQDNTRDFMLELWDKADIPDARRDHFMALKTLLEQQVESLRAAESSYATLVTGTLEWQP